MKQVVFVKHEPNGVICLFETPAPLFCGETVIFDTSGGETKAECVTSSFFAADDTLDRLVCRAGARLPLQRITGRVAVEVTERTVRFEEGQA